ncbi:MAG TPA: aminotransferase class V-fold PLP-dependent enzyme, partial [Gemmatimonadales bacterium]|nr:aminotransferase class V-fold PLP-dependent enzyme [Gemmatimonadales bacterium]
SADPAAAPRLAPSPTLDLTPDEFRRLGHELGDRIGEMLAAMPAGRVTPGEPPRMVRSALGGNGLPARGTAPAELLAEATDLLFAHSLHNGHPRFWGYITGSAAPLGMLGDLLAASVNPNVGASILSPMATEIELQAVRWIADLVGCPAGTGGLLVSGGNMANIVGLLAARRAKAPGDVRADGVRGLPPLVVYASSEAHTWVQKAADLMGLGTKAIRWIPVDGEGRMRPDALEAAIVADRAAGLRPIAVVGTAGTVGTGVVDPLRAIALTCRAHDLWFHVDGAYGAPAAVLPESDPDLRALREADSIALDPHKWLYAPLEAGCVLVRDPDELSRTFSFDPVYYNFAGDPDDPPVNFLALGPQNSRGFRALKVWLGLRQAGREGIVRLIREDIALARALHRAVAARPELEALSCRLSIATFRYVPPDLRAEAGSHGQYLDRLNKAIVDRIQREGEAFVSNAVVDGRYALRACIVNFRTTLADVEALPAIMARTGRDVDATLRNA